MKHTTTQLMDALKAKVHIHKAGGFLAWNADGRGPAMRKGEEVTGSYITVLGHRVEYKRAAWALLTGQFLDHSKVLDMTVNPADYRTWRVVERAAYFRALTLADGGRLYFKEWIDHRGKVCKPSKTQRSAIDTGWEKPHAG